MKLLKQEQQQNFHKEIISRMLAVFLEPLDKCYIYLVSSFFFNRRRLFAKILIYLLLKRGINRNLIPSFRIQPSKLETIKMRWSHR